MAVSVFKPPYLQQLRLDRQRIDDPKAYPFTLPFLQCDFELAFTRPLTVIVGANMSGKSSLLEAIAALCGFGTMGGRRDYALHKPENKLADALRAVWKPKITNGYFVRAESFHAFAEQIDEIRRGPAGAAIYDYYDGKSLHEQSHGQAYLSMFRNNLRGRGLYILDEPEASLSPTRQMEFLQLIHRQVQQGEGQFIIATHSPLIMAYPGATLLEIDGAVLRERSFRAIEHFHVLQRFYQNPDAFMTELLELDK